MSGLPWVALRCRNDAPLLRRTLAGLENQQLPHRLLVLDNGSRDGSRELAAARATKVVDIPPDSYIPGRVLNRGMAETDGELVIFLNSDCEPQGDHYLNDMFAAMEDTNLAAGFGRQDPRPDCAPLMAKDTIMTFGDGSRQGRWLHCFSMASSVIRRSVWETLPFSESLRYSEDVDWTWRARLCGYGIRYIPEAGVYHSHNYTLSQLEHRQYGEGYAEAEIFEWTGARAGLLRYSVLPWGRLVLSDLAWCARNARLGGAIASPLTRAVMAVGRRRGFTGALKARGEAASRPPIPGPYAHGASAAFNDRFGAALQELVDHLRQAAGEGLLGVVLSGGYGRGEGACVKDQEGRERGWNDVDLIPVIRPGGERATAQAIEAIGEARLAFEGEFDVELDFGRPLTESGIRQLRPTLLWIETARGHRVLGAEADLFSRNIRFDPQRCPLPVEGEKLLINRGAGLLLAYAKARNMICGTFDVSGDAFVRKNLAKCALALGDSLLIATRTYETPLDQKRASFHRSKRAIVTMLGDREDQFRAVERAYGRGIDFKLCPDSFMDDPPVSDLEELAGLWVECFGAIISARMRIPWGSASAFSIGTAILEGGEHDSPRRWGRNLFLNLFPREEGDSRQRRISLRYPRERLFRVLPVLLEGVAAGNLPEQGTLDSFIALWKRFG